MWKFNFRLLEAFLALTLLSVCTTPVTTRTFSKLNINTTTMADTTQEDAHVIERSKAYTETLEPIK